MARHNEPRYDTDLEFKHGQSLKDQEREEKAEKKLAAESISLAKAEYRAIKRRLKVQKRERELALAKRGQKRSFFTGRVVLVRRSRNGRNDPYVRARPGHGSGE